MLCYKKDSNGKPNDYREYFVYAELVIACIFVLGSVFFLGYCFGEL